MKLALIAAAICAVAALLEGIAAGSGVRQHLTTLRQPRWALPFAAWLLVGGLYYLLCFAVLFRLLALPPSYRRTFALTTIVVLMVANAGFNVIFFRRRNLFASFVFFLPYSAVAIALFVQLLVLEPATAAIFGPYLLYFIYATAWGYHVWRLNRHAGNVSQQPQPVA